MEAAFILLPLCIGVAVALFVERRAFTRAYKQLTADAQAAADRIKSETQAAADKVEANVKAAATHVKEVL